MPLDDDYSGLIIFLAAILGLVTLPIPKGFQAISMSEQQKYL